MRPTRGRPEVEFGSTRGRLGSIWGRSGSWGRFRVFAIRLRRDSESSPNRGPRSSPHRSQVDSKPTPQFDPTSTTNRPQIDPRHSRSNSRSARSRSQIDLKSAPSRPQSDPRAIPNQPQIDPGSTLQRPPCILYCCPSHTQGVLTFLFFPILVLLAWLADVGLIGPATHKAQGQEQRELVMKKLLDSGISASATEVGGRRWPHRSMPRHLSDQVG